MVASDCFGAETPRSMVARSAPRLPSLHNHFPRVRSGPTVLPPASEPWHPLQVPPATERDSPVMFEVMLSQQDQAAPAPTGQAQRASTAVPARR